jgi:hypothetical protein
LEFDLAVARLKRLLGAKISFARSFLLVAAPAVVLSIAPPAISAEATITSHGAAASATYAPDSTTSLTLSVPTGTQVGDVLVASLGFGKNGATTQPVLTAPAGWTLVSRTNKGAVGALAVYWHVFAGGETGYTWTTNVTVGGAVFLAAFGGVDTTNPIDVSKGQTSKRGTAVSTPSVTTTTANAMLVASYFGSKGAGTSTVWTPPAGMTEIGDASDRTGTRSGSLDDAIQATAGASGRKTAVTSLSQDYGVAVLTALRPAGGAPSGAVPLIVDTDIFSDADDVGALATAFGLQLKGEAKVIAIGVNTRTSRPAVAENSWKCAAAVAQFYNSGDIPLGSDTPNDGTATNTPDFVGPCSTRAAPSTPTPDTAVNVFRRALTGQADGSVVMVSIGYCENLSALLNSPADSISPLNGRDLVARKVSTLVIMAGGYPSRNGETNLIGNPAAAQDVSNNWPTKIVWSGYEVGDAVHTGQTISGTHPSTSPVRIAYEAFVGPNNWIYSYDLTAIYHAIRPADSLLTEVGPGTNVIDDTGGNTFTMGSGNQYYLQLTNATALDSSIETLLDTLPTTPPGDTTPPVISGVGAGSVTSSGATVFWATDEPSDSQVEYGPSTAYGSVTVLDSSLVTNHSQVLSGLAPGSLYHYRVKSRDSAGNLAVSADYSFTTAASAPVGPADTFDTNTIDPAMWAVTSSGSTVAAANQELEITHSAGAWTKGSVVSRTPHDQTGRAVQVQVKRAANNGLGGSTFGETSVFLWLDATHYAYFFVAGGSLSAWVNRGSGEVNLTPSWPAYTATGMQWLRFRESAGTLYWEYAAGAGSPGTWTVLASTPNPFPVTAVTFKIAAGSNVNTTDTAQFDNVSTY